VIRLPGAELEEQCDGGRSRQRSQPEHDRFRVPPGGRISRELRLDTLHQVSRRHDWPKALELSLEL
jgi:hypothetical protein